MSKTAKVWIGVVIVILIIVVVSLGKKNTESETIKIGYIGPFTGPVASTSGEDIGNGWKLAVLKRPELAGKKVEVIYEDDACDPKKAVSAATKLINIDKVKILVNGVCSGSMVAVAPVAESNKVILFTPVSTSPKITDAGDYIFRTSGTGVHTALAYEKYLKQSGYNKIAIIFENAEYPVGIKEAFQPIFTKDTVNSIVAVEGVNSNDTDMRSQLLKISALKPQALVAIFNSSVTANAFIKQIKDLGIKLPVFGNEYFAFSVVVENPDAEGIYATQYDYDLNAPTYLDYLNEYSKTYGKKPSQDIYAALPFDGYNVLADVIESCKGDDPECLKKGLYAVKGYKGITGEINIDEKGDTQRQFTLRKIQNKQLVNVE